MSLKDDSTYKILVSQLKEGNKLAYRKLYDHFYSDVYAYSISLLKSKSIVEDIVQEVFIKIWMKREELNPELSFRSYIFTITRNMAFNKLSKAANHVKLREQLFYNTQYPENKLDHNLMDEAYRTLKEQAISNLTPRCKQVFEMSRNEGMSYEEISQELGISVNTVKNQMSTALGSIRTFLTGHGDFSFAFLVLVEIYMNR